VGGNKRVKQDEDDSGRQMAIAASPRRFNQVSICVSRTRGAGLLIDSAHYLIQLRLIESVNTSISLVNRTAVAITLITIELIQNILLNGSNREKMEIEPQICADRCQFAVAAGPDWTHLTFPYCCVTADSITGDG
jgi:hypothetical protein